MLRARLGRGSCLDPEDASTSTSAASDVGQEVLATAGDATSAPTVVVVSVGATPPAHLGADYVDHAPLLAAARAEVAAACD